MSNPGSAYDRERIHILKRHNEMLREIIYEKNAEIQRLKDSIKGAHFKGRLPKDQDGPSLYAKRAMR